MILIILCFVIGLILEVILISACRNGQICRGLGNVGITAPPERKLYFPGTWSEYEIALYVKNYFQGIETAACNSYEILVLGNYKGLNQPWVKQEDYKVFLTFKEEKYGMNCNVTARPNTGGITDSLIMQNCNYLIDQAVICINKYVQEKNKV